MQGVSERAGVEAANGRARIVADDRHGHRAEAAGDQIMVGIEIGLDVPGDECDAGL